MDIDVFDPGIYTRGIPYDAFKHLRHEAPVSFQKEPGGRGFWAITKHRDIVAISRDPATFSSQRGATNLEDYEEDSDDLGAMRLMMLNMDPPQHVKFRNLVKHGFIPRVVQLLTPGIYRRVNDILNRVAERGECDFVHDIAAQLPLEVICEMIGVPDEDRAMIIDWADRMVASFGPRSDPEILALRPAAEACSMQMLAYAGELAEKRFATPGDDLISVLMQGVVDGERLTPMEFSCFFMLLVVAGNETTRNVIAGGMLSLIEHPEARAQLLAHRELLPSAVEEITRWHPPIIYFRRTATRDVELRGQKIRENDKVALYYPSANRDEDVFDRPDAYDLTRQPNDHISFGMGQHACLGAALARLELRVMFEQLLVRMPDIELAGPVKRLRSNFVNGIVSMPVRYTPGRVLSGT